MRSVEWRSGLLVFIAIVALWEAIELAGFVSSEHVPPPSKIVSTVFTEAVSGELTEHAWTTLRRFAVGYTLAAAIGIPFGFALGRWPLVYAALEPIIEFLRPMPVVAILPIAMFVLGLGDTMAYSVIGFGAGWIVLLHAMDGVRSVDPVLVETGRTLRVTGARLFWTIVVPAAAPHVFTGLRVSLGITLILAVVIEMIVGFGGLGAYIGLSQGASRVPETYAGILVVGLLGYLLNRLFLAFEGQVMAWHRGSTRH